MAVMAALAHAGTIGPGNSEAIGALRSVAGLVDAVLPSFANPLLDVLTAGWLWTATLMSLVFGLWLGARILNKRRCENALNSWRYFLDLTVKSEDVL